MHAMRGQRSPNSGECVSFPSSGCKVPYCALCEKKLEVCTRCEASYYITPLHGCTKDCEDLMGYHNNADLGKCVRCRIRNCYKCYDSARCSECSTGYGLTDNQQCVRCPKNCFACAHHNKCTTCKSGYILSDSEVCESEDEYKVDCKHADAKYIKYEFARHIKGSVRQRLTASMCSECNAGKVPINGKCVSVSAKAPSCTPGTGENAGKCTRCISSGSSNSTFLYSGVATIAILTWVSLSVQALATTDCAPGAHGAGLCSTPVVMSVYRVP